MSCLYELAATGQLPEHQFMDERTLDWIESNETTLFPERPSMSFSHRVTAITVMTTIERFAPKIEWYSHPLLADSIHGLRHTMRVIALAPRL
jgi:hypothetical protein